MAKNKKPESVTDKKWRLEQIREQMNEFEQQFRLTPDYVEVLLSWVREWASLNDLSLSENELSDAGRNSVFSSLIRFCKDELGKIAEHCENRRLSGLGTLREDYIQTIKDLCQADNLETVEELCLYLVNVYIAHQLARIMRISYRALKNPGTLDDLNISELRGDLLEVVAHTYADIITVMREEAEKGIKQGLDQAETTIKAIDAKKKIRKAAGVDMEEMKTRASELKAKHSSWGSSALARELHKKFPKVPFHTIRKYDWLKKLTNP